MEVHFTAEQEAQLSRIAAHDGKNPEQVVQEAVGRMLEDEGRFLEGVRRGIDQADQDQFIEEDEMDAHVERMLRP